MTDLRAPFPWFGGKARAAQIVWSLLGDPGGYVEPFCGSAAVLLARPEFRGRRVETLNDADGWLVNMWRAIQIDPGKVARYAWGPVSEIDYHARLAWLQERRSDGLVSWLEGDPEAHDAKAAGWWLTVCAAGIGNPWRAGPWRVVDGRLVKGNAGQGVNRELPHLGDAGRGVNRELPHLGNADGGIESLTAYLVALSVRLQRVRITCGDWRRVLTPSPLNAGTGGDGSLSVFLDPPYSTSPHLYAESGHGISEQVREWCLTATAKKGGPLRMVLCGYDDEHKELESLGWSVMQGRSGRGSGYSKRADNGRRERLWVSPACLAGGTQSAFSFETGGEP